MSRVGELAEAAAEAKTDWRATVHATNTARNRVIELEREEQAKAEAYQKAKAALMRELA